MPLTLMGMRCLVEIVDADLNISSASQALHLSQPCVSRHLKQVEEALGFRVFERRGRSLVEVTAAGLEAVAVGRRVVRELDSLRCYADNSRAETCGELRIAAPQTYAESVLPPLLRRLRERWPGVSVGLCSLGEGGVVRAADHRHCDVVIVSTAGAQVPPGIAVPLFRWRRVVIVAPDHPLARQPAPLPLAALAAWPLVTYEASRRRDSSLRRSLAAAGLEPRFSCSADDAATLKAYARVGLGVGLVAELSIRAADRAEFAVLPVHPALPACTAWAVLPEHRLLRNATLELVRLLAPQVDAADLRRALRGMPPAQWPEPPEYGRAPAPDQPALQSLA
jgi:DNA-binding transcriptional LysR family regulator